VVADLLADDGEGNPGLVLGSALAGTAPQRDKIVLVDQGSGTVGLSAWVRQLLLGSTGSGGAGLLPVEVEGPQAPELGWDAADVLVVRLVPAEDAEEFTDDAQAGAAPDDAAPDAAALDGPAPDHAAIAEVSVAGPLGAQFLLWEYAAVVAARLLGVNPFPRTDTPDTTDTPDADASNAEALDADIDTEGPALVDGAVELRAVPDLLDGVTQLPTALARLLERVPADGYLAVTAYLDRDRDAVLAGLRPALAARLRRPVTFSWVTPDEAGPAYGAGPPSGVLLQITAEPAADVLVAGGPVSFGRLLRARAAGDAQRLVRRGRAVLRVHLRERPAGTDQLLAAMGVQP